MSNTETIKRLRDSADLSEKGLDFLEDDMRPEIEEDIALLREAADALEQADQRLTDARGEGPYDDPKSVLLTVHGVEVQRTYLPTSINPFEEEYEFAVDHPAQALLRLVSEIEWGILDSDREFSIEVKP